MRYQDFFTYDEVDGFRPRRMAGEGGGGLGGPFASWEEEEEEEDDDEAQARARDSGGRAASAAAAAALARKAADEDVKVLPCMHANELTSPRPPSRHIRPHSLRTTALPLPACGSVPCGVQAQAHDFQPYWGRAMEAAAQGPGGRRRPGSSGGRHSPRPDDPSLTATAAAAAASHVPRALVIDRPAPAAAARPSRRTSSSLLEYAGADAGRLLRLGPHGDGGGDDEPRRSRLRERDKHFWGDPSTSELAELLARPAPPPTSAPLAPATAATGGGSGRAPSPTRRGRVSRDVDKDTAANTAANRNLSAVRGGERGLVPLAAATRRRYFSVELLDPQVGPVISPSKASL